MGWFRDYLWFNSSQMINGYSAYGANDLAVWDWIFLLAHLVWALGFMFLISWRGYWQELIDSILFMHLQAPVLGNIWQGQYYTPIALSIVQARFIGLVHFSVGFILQNHRIVREFVIPPGNPEITGKIRIPRCHSK